MVNFTDFNPFQFAFDVALHVSRLVERLYNFLFSEIDFGIIQLSMWQLLGGVGIVTLIIGSIISAVT